MPPLAAPASTVEAHCRNLEATLELAARLGKLLAGGETIGLAGNLGSGKTTFTRGLCGGLGLVDLRLVSSPTYVLEHIYPGRRVVHHYDAYRLASPAELLALGFEEHLTRGDIVIVEWADRVLDVLPRTRLLIEISGLAPPAAEDERRIVFSGPAEPWERRLAALLESATASGMPLKFEQSRRG